jgi:hypothetical protein
MKTLILLLLFPCVAQTPGVTWRLVATEFAPMVYCDEQARPKCWHHADMVTDYRWELQP